MSDRDLRPLAGEGATPTDPFRQMAEQAPIGMVAARPDGVVVWVNRRWREMTGIEQPVPIPYEVVEPTIHPDDRFQLWEAYNRSGTDVSSFEFNSRIVREDGRVLYVFSQGAPVLDDEGTITGYVGIITDLTESVELDAARQRSDERFRNLIAKAPMGQTVVTLDGKIVEVNHAYAALVGRTPDELGGTSALALVHPDDRDAAIEMAAKLLRGEVESIEHERRLLRPDGSSVWVSSATTLERDPTGAPLSFYAHAMDISVRKEAEDALRKSEARYRKLIDEAPIGQLLCMIDGTLIEVNQAFLDMMGGATVEEMRPMLRAGLLHPDDQDAYYADIRKLMRGEIDRIDRDRRLIRADGEVVWVSGGTTLLREDGAQILHSVMQDITDRKIAEEALTKSENRFRTLTESIPAGVYQADGTGRVTYVNPQWFEITRHLGRADDPRRGDGPGAPRRLRPGGQGSPLAARRRRRLPRPVPHHRLARVRALDPQPGRGDRRTTAARSPASSAR